MTLMHPGRTLRRGPLLLALYLPGHVTVPSYEGREITLLDLATHTSALPSSPMDVSSMRSRVPFLRAEAFTVDDAYAFFSDYRLSREPGSRYNYSNFGYGLLGHALGRAAGVGFRELVRSRILDPWECRIRGSLSRLSLQSG